MKADLEMCVQRLQESDTTLYRGALEQLRSAIRAATSTVTSVPKPLKFLRPHYATMKTVYESILDPEIKAFASDVVSLLALTYDDVGRECLKYRGSGSKESIESWGHEYVRHLSSEIAEEFKENTEADPPRPVTDLLGLVSQIVPYYMTHSAEADACDLAMEVDNMSVLEQFCDAKACDRVCQYLLACVPFVPEPENETLMRTCLALFRKFEKWPQAMQMALKLNDLPSITEVFLSCSEKHTRRQIAFMLGRQQVWFDLEVLLEGQDESEIEVLKGIISNSSLNTNFLALARELDIVEPKIPEDIYKTHLDPAGRSTIATVDSARANLAATFVNAFVNAGFGNDKLVLGDGKQGSKWMHKNKDHGMMSAAASMGMLLLWDVDGGLTQIDAFLTSSEDYIKAGALLGLGIVNSGVRHENDPALGLLEEYILSSVPCVRVGANMGLGLAYAGSGNTTAGDLLRATLMDPASTNEVLGVAALGLGQIYVGTCDGDTNEAIVTAILTRQDADLADPSAKFLALGLGLLYFGKQQMAEVALATVGSVTGVFGKIACILVDSCAYAGTGNVLKVQSLLHFCSEHVDISKEGAKESDCLYQAFAVVGIALVAMGEDVGTDMALRSFNHILQYGEPVLRRAVPIAIALLCTSNPKLSVLDTLSKLSHDPDGDTAYAAILALGFVGAGTNHARIGGMLRTLAQYYNKDANALFSVRIAQGLLHTGKGSITLSPSHTDRSLLSPVAVAGVLASLLACLDTKNILFKSGHYMLYHVALAMFPRILSTFDEDLNPVNTSVRVGTAVDTVGQAGNPKTITGFVTNNTPVLLGHGERAQLASDEFLPLTPVLEGFVIVRKNPEYAK